MVCFSSLWFVVFTFSSFSLRNFLCHFLCPLSHENEFEKIREQILLLVFWNCFFLNLNNLLGLLQQNVISFSDLFNFCDFFNFSDFSTCLIFYLFRHWTRNSCSVAKTFSKGPSTLAFSITFLQLWFF